jgi:two-component system nitrate/nitrite response regulator NarL
MSAIQVLLADDHPLYRAGVANVIDQHPELELMAECSEGREALNRIRELKPDVAVLDLKLPKLDGVAILEALRRGREEGTRAIILSAFDESEAVYRAISAGARAYVLKSATGDEICRAITTVAAGDTWLPQAVHAGLASEIRLRREFDARPVLTERELEVLRVAAEGGSVGDIAEKLFISTATVKTHLAHIYEKFEVSDRTAAVAEALRRGLLD